MADVSISYKGNEIASMNATGVKTLLTSSAFCEDDITVTYTKPAAPVPTLQTKSATYTPSTSQQTASITADAGYDALGEVNVTVDAMPSGTAGTPTATKGTVSSNSVSVTPSVTNTTGYITGGTKTGTPVTVSASELVSGTKTITGSGTTDVTNYASASVSSGSATTPATTITANPSISVSSGGLITASVSASQSVTPTVSAGYVSSGTAGTVSVSGSNTSQLTTQAAQTIHPSTTDQTIASGKYLTGAQTVLGVLLSNLTAGNIKKDVVVKIGDSTDDDCVASVTGTYEGGGGGGGASNICQGTFTTGNTGASAGTFDTGYTGSGYPIAMFIYVDGGPYNNQSEYGGNTTWYNSKVRYNCGFYAMVKSVLPQPPSYSSGSSADISTAVVIYKNSTSSATTYSRNFAMNANTYVSAETDAVANLGCARFKGNATTVSYYVSNGTSDTIGFPKNTQMAYIVIYSS